MLLDLFQRGGLVMWPILAASVVALGVVIDRAVYLLRTRDDRASLTRAVFGLVDRGELGEARERCRRSPQPVAAVLEVGLASWDQPRGELERRLDGLLGSRGPRQAGDAVVRLRVALAKPRAEERQRAASRRLRVRRLRRARTRRPPLLRQARSARLPRLGRRRGVLLSHETQEQRGVEDHREDELASPSALAATHAADVTASPRAPR